MGRLSGQQAAEGLADLDGPTGGQPEQQSVSDQILQQATVHDAGDSTHAINHEYEH